jgi:hypothetical protein
MKLYPRLICKKRMPQSLVGSKEHSQDKTK